LLIVTLQPKWIQTPARSAPAEHHRIRDLTQEFFARLLARAGLGQVDPERGRFRFFLLSAVKHFLADVHDEQCRLKRGGGQVPVSLDAGTDSSPGMEIADASLPSPELEFDREWAVTLLARALERLRCEQTGVGKGEQFPAVKPWLTGDKQNASQKDSTHVREEMGYLLEVLSRG
jgi:DNA-directed RNA polymerase specialized sigma24 family protein